MAPWRLLLLSLLLIGGCLGTGMLASLAHLGTKMRAWRALGNLRKSWLSREVLFTGLFGTGWLFTTVGVMLFYRSFATGELAALTATLGLGLVYSMSKVYRLPSISAWNTWRTNAVFMVSALLLGQSLMAVLLPSNVASIVLLILLVAQLLLMYKPFFRDPFHSIRIWLILTGLVLTVLSIFLPSQAHTWISLLIFLNVAAEEGIGRWLFYQAAQGSSSSR